MFLSDYPRGLVNSLLYCFPALDALPVTAALAVAFLLARRRFPVSLLRLPPRPLARLLAAALTAIPLARLLRMKALLAPLQQTEPCTRSAGPAFPPPR